MTRNIHNNNWKQINMKDAQFLETILVNNQAIAELSGILGVYETYTSK